MKGTHRVFGVTACRNRLWGGVSKENKKRDGKEGPTGVMYDILCTVLSRAMSKHPPADAMFLIIEAN